MASTRGRGMRQVFASGPYRHAPLLRLPRLSLSLQLCPHSHTPYVLAGAQERRRHVYTTWAHTAECEAVEAHTLALLTAIRALYVAAGVAGEAGASTSRTHGSPPVEPQQTRSCLPTVCVALMCAVHRKRHHWAHRPADGPVHGACLRRFPPVDCDALSKCRQHSCFCCAPVWRPHNQSTMTRR